MYGLDVPNALKKISELMGSAETKLKVKNPTSPSQITITRVIDGINHPGLQNYLQSRFIPTIMSNKLCKEIHYTNGHSSFFSIGFKNDLGGWATRNARFKGCIGKQTISTIERDTDIFITEGFIDYMSAIVLNPNVANCTAIILNSTMNTKAAVQRIKELKPRRIYAALDNDDGGVFALKKFMVNFSDLIDLSPRYSANKDLNDYLKWKMKNTP